MSGTEMRQNIRHAFIWPAAGPVLVYGYDTAAKARKALEKAGFEFNRWCLARDTYGWVDPGFTFGPNGVEVK